MIHQLFIRLLDVLWREPKMIRRYYSIKNTCMNGKTKLARNIFMVDGRVGHGGMFDRLKGAISVYAVSKSQRKDFRIHFNYPFDLQKYLEPNQYDWMIDDREILYSYPYSRPLFLYGECFHPVRLYKNRSCESHFYYGYDSLTAINSKFGSNYEWGQLYRELFKPTPYLQQYIDYYRKEIGQDYIVVHTRFLNLLGDKVETAINPELEQAKKDELMKKIGDKIKELSIQHVDASGKPLRLMLASDSMTFITYMKQELPDVYVVPGEVKHIDTAGETNDAENIKMFLDYYLISNAKKVYNLVREGMWPSAFSEYAAKIGETGFERIYIK